MALEVAAAIIGILAAAAKVADKLGPVVSALSSDYTQHASAILSEVNSSRIILAALQVFLGDLETAPLRRRRLIGVEQLIAALTDGVLLYSELEGLVGGAEEGEVKLSKRMQWAWNDKDFAALLLRAQNFKSSMSVMLNILQCESDMEAQRNGQDLILITSSLLKSNLELSRRIEILENCFDSSRSILAERPVSHLWTEGADQQANQEATSDVLRMTNRRLSILSVKELQNAPFETDLETSRVYRRARRHTADYSFRSSTALSHAWSTLSDLSLSDISIIAVVALPVIREDLTNLQHYTFQDDGEKPAPGNFDNGPERLGAQSPDPPIAPTYLRSSSIPPSPPISPLSSNNDFRLSTQLRIVIKGAMVANINNLAARFASPPYLPGSDENLINSYAKVCVIDGLPVSLDIQVLSKIPGNYVSGLDSQYLGSGEIYMFVYNTQSRSSFDYVSRMPRQIRQWKETESFPMMIVANRPTTAQQRTVSDEQRLALARKTRCETHEVSEDDVASLHAAFADLVRARWAYERQEDEKRRAEEEKDKKERSIAIQFTTTMRQLLRRPSLARESSGGSGRSSPLKLRRSETVLERAEEDTAKDLLRGSKT